MAKRDLIQARTLKGFPDRLPAAMLPREELIETARRVYRSFGFAPIDTPALEYTEILLGKGGEESDKQLYRFRDHGDRDVALRFDLTVPLARFAAQHLGEIGLPFKRYQMGPVWRGENTQRGRYREFWQCDFDTIGTESRVADVETVLVVHELMLALGVERFTIRLNDRRLLSGLLERAGLSEHAVGVLRAVDKLAKIGRAKVEEEILAAGGAKAPEVKALLDVLTAGAEGGASAAGLSDLGSAVAGSETGEEGHEAISELLGDLASAGVPAGRVQLDVSIARGLDYYTGPVFETLLDDLPGIGSVCSGGRYDDLASLYTKERLPGVGASLGIDRLLDALRELGALEERTAAAPIFLAYFDASRRGDYLALATRLRRAGFAVEFFPEPRKLGAQLKYADRRGLRLAIVIGEQEWLAGRCLLKHLDSSASEDIGLADLEDALRRSAKGRA
jgi:histidyl-tRNA synthetase